MSLRTGLGDAAGIRARGDSILSYFVCPRDESPGNSKLAPAAGNDALFDFQMDRVCRHRTSRKTLAFKNLALHKS